MAYDETLAAVRALSEQAMTRPVQSRRKIAPYVPPAPKPAAAAPAEPPPSNVVRFEPAPIVRPKPVAHDGWFTHRVSGLRAFSLGQDETQRTILIAGSRRFTCTDAELQLYWRPESKPSTKT